MEGDLYKIAVDGEKVAGCCCRCGPRHEVSCTRRVQAVHDFVRLFVDASRVLSSLAVRRHYSAIGVIALISC